MPIGAEEKKEIPDYVLIPLHREIWRKKLMEFVDKWSQPIPDCTDNELVASSLSQANALIASMQFRFDLFRVNDDDEKREGYELLVEDKHHCDGSCHDDHDEDDGDHMDLYDDGVKKGMKKHKTVKEGFIDGCRCQQPWPLLNQKAIAAVNRLCDSNKPTVMDSLLVLHKHAQLGRYDSHFPRSFIMIVTHS